MTGTPPQPPPEAIQAAAEDAAREAFRTWWPENGRAAVEGFWPPAAALRVFVAGFAAAAAWRYAGDTTPASDKRAETIEFEGGRAFEREVIRDLAKRRNARTCHPDSRLGEAFADLLDGTAGPATHDPTACTDSRCPICLRIVAERPCTGYSNCTCADCVPATAGSGQCGVCGRPAHRVGERCTAVAADVDLGDDPDGDNTL